MISKFSKAAVFDVFVARRCGFRYYWMQDVVPRCAIFAKLQNSLIQPRTSQKKFSLFENVSYFVFIVWRSTDRQFFLFSLCDFTQTSRFRSVREIAIILQTVHALLRDPLATVCLGFSDSSRQSDGWVL